MQLVIDNLQSKLEHSESDSHDGALARRQLEDECERHRAQREELLDKAAGALVQKVHPSATTDKHHIQRYRH